MAKKKAAKKATKKAAKKTAKKKATKAKGVIAKMAKGMSDVVGYAEKVIAGPFTAKKGKKKSKKKGGNTVGNG